MRLGHCPGHAPRRLVGVALVVAVCGLARPVSAESQPAEVGDTRADAQRTFTQAQQLYEAGRTEAALEAFRSSHAGYPSPNSRLYIARCLRDLGRNAEAYTEFKAVLMDAAEADDADRYAQTLEAASLERASLRPRLGMLRLTVPDDVPMAEVSVAGRVVSRAEWGQPIAVDPGTVSVSATAPGRRPFLRTYSIAAGERPAATVVLPPAGSASPAPAPAAPAQPAPPVAAPWPTGRAVAIGSAGVAVVGFAVWGAFGLQARARYDHLRGECDQHCGPEFKDSINAGRTETLISEVGLGVAAAGAAGCILGLILGPGESRTGSLPGLELGRAQARLTWGGVF
jgi:hypothetical protein